MVYNKKAVMYYHDNLYLLRLQTMGQSGKSANFRD